jgi:hypothetical protein
VFNQQEIIKMKNKNMLALVAAALSLNISAASASSPRISLAFHDPQGLCRDSKNNTHFSFNYAYEASGGVQYYSGPIMIESSTSTIVTPLPPNDGVTHNYTSFEITDAGDCGNFELDYQHLGSCYLTNLIPPENQLSPYSYIITLTPQLTGNHTYGADMYNLSCQVESFT